MMSINFDRAPAVDSVGDSRSPDISLLREDTYAVLAFDRTMGYIEKVGNVFVGLVGEDLPHAIEVGQSLSFDVTVDMVIASDRRWHRASRSADRVRR